MDHTVCNMFRLYTSKKTFLMMVGDVFLFAVSFLLALVIRFDFKFSPAEFTSQFQYFPTIAGIQLLGFIVAGVYVSMWRYTSVNSILRLSVAAVCSFFLILGVLLYVWGYGFSRGVLAIDLLLTILSTGGMRLAVRIFFEHARKTGDQTGNKHPESAKQRRIIILGAGNAGEMIVREMLKSPTVLDIPVAILDDNPRKIGRAIHGVPVIGAIEALAEAAAEQKADEVFICIPSAAGSAMRRIIDICDSSGVKYKTLPGVNELILQDFNLATLREVRYEDLLGREPVVLALDRIKEYLTDKVVLVTGGGGSIGSELCRQILRFNPRQILLLDAGEFNLFNISSELATFHNYKNGVSLLANLTDMALLRRIFEQYKPDVVFHAAAYKHVPLLEINPWEAVYNNIVASRNLIEASLEYCVGTFVLVSTDKAVRPTNVMGASKRVTELLLRAHMDGTMRCMAVRFGNVIGSSGSVIPFFLKQIKAGKPVTVTHPEVTRYFMTIGEAAQLIVQAGGMGAGGETFLIKMGQAVRIRDIAADLIRLCGKVPERDVPIVFTGLRPGEKLYEELITAGENVVPTLHEQFMKLRADLGGNSPEERSSFREALLEKILELQRAADHHDAAGIKRVLRDIVPEYLPQDLNGCVL